MALYLIKVASRFMPFSQQIYPNSTFTVSRAISSALNPLLNKSRMFQTRSIYLPRWRFARCVYQSTIHAQVTAFTAAKLRHACQEQILRRIHIAVMNCAALRACPLSLIEPQFVQFVRALSARLAGRKPSIHRNHGTAVPLGLVLDQASELSEARVGEMPRQRRVLNHAFHVQIFDADNLVLMHKARGERVQGVTALVRHGAMGASDTQPLLLATLRSFLPPREATLLLFQVSQPVGEMARVLDLLAAAQHGQMFEAKVHADHRGRNGQQSNLDRSGERDVVTPIRFALERDGIGTSHHGEFLGDLHFAELRQADGTAHPLCFADILKPERNRIVITRPEARITRRLAGLHAPEKMGEGGVLVAQRLRQAGGRRVGEPGEARQRFEFGQAAGDIHAGNGLLTPLISFGARIERPVPEPTGSAVPRIKHSDLRRVGIGADTEGPLNGRHALIIAHAGPQRIPKNCPRVLCFATGLGGRSTSLRNSKVFFFSVQESCFLPRYIHDSI